jgi:hypothetical protein
MSIIILKKNNLYNVTVDNNTVKDVYIYRIFPIKFHINQDDINFFLSNFCNVKNCHIQDCDVDFVVKCLENFIILQNNLFLFNQESERGILEEILSILNSSKNILRPIPSKEAGVDIKTEFNNFLKENIIFFEDNTSTITSTEIKRKFYKTMEIEQKWQDENFKKINNEVNSALNSWERENNITSSLSKGLRYCFKTFYGIGFKIEK